MQTNIKRTPNKSVNDNNCYSLFWQVDNGRFNKSELGNDCAVSLYTDKLLVGAVKKLIV